MRMYNDPQISHSILNKVSTLKISKFLGYLKKEKLKNSWAGSESGREFRQCGSEDKLLLLASLYWVDNLTDELDDEEEHHGEGDEHCQERNKIRNLEQIIFIFDQRIVLGNY